VAFPQYAAFSTRSKIIAAMAATEKIQQEMKVYYAKNGSWPATPTALNSSYPNVTYTHPSGGVTSKPNCMTTSPSPGNALWGSQYIDSICVYPTSYLGNPAGRVDIQISATAVGLPITSNWYNAQHSKMFYVDSSGTMNTVCFEGGGSPYGAYFPEKC